MKIENENIIMSMLNVGEANAVAPESIQAALFDGETRGVDDDFWKQIAMLKTKGIMLCRDKHGRIYQAKDMKEFTDYRKKVLEGKLPAMIEIG